MKVCFIISHFYIKLGCLTLYAAVSGRFAYVTYTIKVLIRAVLFGAFLILHVI